MICRRISTSRPSCAFLNSFDSTRLAAIKEGGTKRCNIDFHKEFAGEGKTIQDLVDYMGKNGLRFAPAVSGDEDAYQGACTRCWPPTAWPPTPTTWSLPQSSSKESKEIER